MPVLNKRKKKERQKRKKHKIMRKKKKKSTAHQRLNPVVLCNRELKLKYLAHQPQDSALGGCVLNLPV